MKDLTRLVRVVRAVCNSDEWDCWEGGCAIFAVALNRFLGGKDTDRLFVGSYSTHLKRKYGSYMYYHVALQYEGVLIDGGGVTTPDILLEHVDETRGQARIRYMNGKDAMAGTDQFEDQEESIQFIEQLLQHEWVKL